MTERINCRFPNCPNKARPGKKYCLAHKLHEDSPYTIAPLPQSEATAALRSIQRSETKLQSVKFIRSGEMDTRLSRIVEDVTFLEGVLKEVIDGVLDDGASPHQKLALAQKFVNIQKATMGISKIYVDMLEQLKDLEDSGDKDELLNDVVQAIERAAPDRMAQILHELKRRRIEVGS